jgi:hypothetical protein
MAMIDHEIRHLRWKLVLETALAALCIAVANNVTSTNFKWFLWGCAGALLIPLVSLTIRWIISKRPAKSREVRPRWTDRSLPVRRPGEWPITLIFVFGGLGGLSLYWNWDDLPVEIQLAFVSLAGFVVGFLLSSFIVFGPELWKGFKAHSWEPRRHPPLEDPSHSLVVAQSKDRTVSGPHNSPGIGP